MTEPTTPQLTEAEVHKITSRCSEIVGPATTRERLSTVLQIVNVDVPALIRDWRAMQGLIERAERTVNTLADESRSLSQQNASLREQLVDAGRERNAYRGQLVSLNTQLAQVTSERDKAQRELKVEIERQAGADL